MATISSNKRPKIAILSLHPSNLGGLLQILKATYEFCSIHFEPTVFCLGFDPEISASLRKLKFSSQMRKSKIFGMDCVEVGARWAFWEPGHYASTIETWEKELEDFDYFFVVSGTPIAAHPLILMKKKFVGWFASPHKADREQRFLKMTAFRKFISKFSEPLMDYIEKKVLEESNFLFPLSRYTKIEFEKISPETAGKSIICGQPMQVQTTAPKRLSKETKKLVAVGRFDDPRKNLPMLLRAFEFISAKEDVFLTVVGPACQHKSSEKIKFTGYISEEEKKQILNESDLMLITSYQEGLGIVGLEAMSRGIPVVSTSCGGVEDYVIENESGFLVPINDHEKMAIKTIEILCNENLYKKLSAGAIDIVRKKFSPEVIRKNFEHGLKATYPKLGEIFEKQRSKDEGFSSRTCLHSPDKPGKMDHLC